MKIDLEGKTSLVCASTKGLGFSCAENLASAGSNIILTGRSEAVSYTHLTLPTTPYV